MGHGPHHARPEGEDKHAALAGTSDHHVSGGCTVRKPEYDDVRAHRAGLEDDPRALGQSVRDEAGIGMILGQA